MMHSGSRPISGRAQGQRHQGPLSLGPLDWDPEPGVASCARLLSLFARVLEGCVRSNRDEAGRSLYNERRKLLAGLMMAETEPWEDLPEHVKERWRRKCDSLEAPDDAAEPGTASED